MNVLFNSQIQTPLSWYGGKTRMIDFVLGSFPPHDQYVEVCGGSGALLFAKAPSPGDVYNDIDPGLVNFFRVLQDPKLGFKLTLSLKLTPNSRQEHQRCSDNYPAADPVEWARQFFVLTRQSYCSIFDHTWGYSVESKGNAFHSAVELLLPAIERLSDVTIENLDVEPLLAKYDGPDTLFYIDPPYLDSTRQSKEVYAHEMTEADHQRLLDLVTDVQGMVVLSGYPSGLYDQSLSGWHKRTKRVPCPSSATTKVSGRTTKPQRTECLWINPQAWNRLQRRGKSVSSLVTAGLLPKS